MSVKELLDMTTTFIREKVYWRVIVKDKNIVGNENNIWGFGIYDSPNPDINDNRYCLELNHCGIDNDKTLITLLMNPSETFPCENDNSNIDDTILNVMKIAKALGIMSVVVLNTIPVINSKKELALNNLDKQKQRYNEMFVNGFLKHCDKENTIYVYYQKKKQEGKHYYACLTACSTKLIRIIYALCMNNSHQQN